LGSWKLGKERRILAVSGDRNTLALRSVPLVGKDPKQEFVSGTALALSAEELVLVLADDFAQGIQDKAPGLSDFIQCVRAGDDTLGRSLLGLLIGHERDAGIH
jgi:hypothetical protein